MKNIIRMIMVLTMIIAFGVQGYAQRYHRYHHHPRPIYRPYYYSPYYGASAVYVTDAYGITRRTYVAPTVVVTRPVYSTSTTRVKAEDTPSLSIDGIKIERESANRVHIKGGKKNVTLDTTKKNLHMVSTKKVNITVQTSGNGDVNVTVQEGNNTTSYTL